MVLFSPNGEPGLSIGLVFSCSLTDFLTATYRTDYRVAIVIKDLCRLIDLFHVIKYVPFLKVFSILLLSGSRQPCQTLEDWYYLKIKLPQNNYEHFGPKLMSSQSMPGPHNCSP